MPLQETLPQNVQKLIHEFARPITRGNWRKGSSCNNAFKYNSCSTHLYNMYVKYYLCSNERTQNQFKLIQYSNSVSDILNVYGEIVFSLSPYKPYIIYNNFYFVLRYFSFLKYTIAPDVYIIDEIVAHNYY